MDKIFKGLAAGIIAAIIMNIINLLLFYNLQLTQIRFLDWAGLIMLGAKPQTKFEIIYSLLIHIFWTGSLGIIFNYIITQISHQGLIIKGGIYAFLLTFVFRTIVVLFEVSLLAKPNITTSIINTTTSFLWGALLGLILIKFDTH